MDALRAGIGGHAGLPLGDTQQMFEEYWQRGKYNDSAPTSNTAADVTSAQSGVGGKAGSVAGTKLEQHHGPSGNASSGNEESGGSDDVPTTLNKAQARRAQVRRAQIQHRQRKADYTKHLEMETAKFRDMIDKTTRESYALEAENETMRQMLVAKLGYLPAEALADAGAEKTKTTAEAITSADDDNAMSWEADGAAVMASERSNSSSSVATPLYSVSIGLSEVMGTPAMQIRRTSSPHRLSSESRTASVSQTPRTASISQTARSDSVPQAPVVPPVSQTPPSRNTSITSQGGGHFEMKPAAFEPADIITSLSEEQTDHAINFILGLEHICWDHWDRSYFTHQEYDETGCMHGHALMASTIALQAAPVEVFNKLDAVGEYLRTNPLHQQDRFEHGHCDHGVAEHVQYDKNMTRPLQGDESRASASSTSSASLMTFPDSGTRSQSLGSNMTLTKGSAKQSPVVQPQVAPAPGIPMLQESNISWPATGLSLETLHALASKLSPPETELAPVQAWFEILRAYGTVVILNQELMAQMLAQFAGVVKCLHFGAVIERDAFDSVVTRVLGRAQWA